jgi:hypothetical protein
MPWVYRYEFVDPGSSIVEVSPIMRTRESILQIGGCVIEDSALEVDDGELVPRGVHLHITPVSVDQGPSVPSLRSHNRSRAFGKRSALPVARRAKK